jgi:hypothetical protein
MFNNTKYLVFLFLSSFLLATNIVAQVLYLGVNGSDSNDGLERSTAVGTLQKAIDLAHKINPINNSITILIEPGTYMNSVNIIEGRTDGIDIKLFSDKSSTRPVVFDGVSNASTWLSIVNKSDMHTSVTVDGLTIKNYKTAITINSNRNDSNIQNGGHVISNNTFFRIGSISNDEISSAAVRLVNSKSNLIEGNKFLTIRNDFRCGKLHALYLAHFSSGNVIRSNVFADLCGSIIKFRDRSNNNIVAYNYFYSYTGSPAVQESFCDKNLNKKCTKKLGECPSTGNIMFGNEYDLHKDYNNKVHSIDGPDKYRPWCNANDYSNDRIIFK